MKVIIYARVSSEEQVREGVSIDNQLEKMRSYCTLYEHEVVEEISDLGLSAKSVNREGMLRVIEMTNKRNPDIEGIVVYKLDRCFRNCEEALRFAGRWDKKGISLISVQEQLDTKSASGRLFFTLLAAMAEWERKTIGERTQVALQYKKGRNEKTGGCIPFGYDVVISDGTKTLVVNKKEQDALRIMKRLKSEGMSLRKIASFLDESGIPTKSGKNGWQAKVISQILSG